MADIQNYSKPSSKNSKQSPSSNSSPKPETPGLFGRINLSLKSLLKEIILYLKWIIDRSSQTLLFFSGAISAYIYRICQKPDSMASFLFALAFSENPQLVVYGQGMIAILVLILNRGYKKASRFTKLLLWINVLTAGLQVSLLKPAFESFDSYKDAFVSNGDGPQFFSNKAAAFLAMISAMFTARKYPLQGNGMITRTNPKNKNVETVPFADMKEVDPQLVDKIEKTSNGMRNIYANLGRGSMKGWLDCDIVRNSEVIASATRNSNKLVPVILAIHGGAWMTVDKAIVLRPTLEYIATNFNVVVVKANYRLAPECTFPDMFMDVKRAIIWTKENIKKYGGNPEQICMIGESAGGHLVSLAAVTQNNPMFQPKESVEKDTTVELVVDIYGVHNMTANENKFLKSPSKHKSGVVLLGENFILKERLSANSKRFEDISPSNQLNKLVRHFKNEELLDFEANIKVPPMMMVHGDKDVLASYEDASEFYEKLLEYRKISGDQKFKNENGKQIKDIFVEIKGGHHGFGYMKSPRSVTLAIAIASFMNVYFENVTQPRSAAKL